MFAMHEWWIFRIPKLGHGAEQHVIPMADLRPHDPDGACWCHPEEDDDYPGLWKHNALDGREAYENGTLELQ